MLLSTNTGVSSFFRYLFIVIFHNTLVQPAKSLQATQLGAVLWQAKATAVAPAVAAAAPPAPVAATGAAVDGVGMKPVKSDKERWRATCAADISGFCLCFLVVVVGDG